MKNGSFRIFEQAGIDDLKIWPFLYGSSLVGVLFSFLIEGKISCESDGISRKKRTNIIFDYKGEGGGGGVCIL